jgi:hypothetical protein
VLTEPRRPRELVRESVELTNLVEERLELRVVERHELARMGGRGSGRARAFGGSRDRLDDFADGLVLRLERDVRLGENAHEAILVVDDG